MNTLVTWRNVLAIFEWWGRCVVRLWISVFMTTLPVGFRCHRASVIIVVVIVVPIFVVIWIVKVVLIVVLTLVVIVVLIIAPLA